MMTEMSPDDLTPVELRQGIYYKREDAFSRPSGVNGSKLRAAFHLVREARARGAFDVVSAQSVLSPQAAISATVAAELGMGSVTIVGGTVPEKAGHNVSIRKAQELGSDIIAGARVGYNPAVQAAGRRFVAENPGSWQMPYGISEPDTSTTEDLRAFVQVGATQTRNFPMEVEHLVLPFGSGNTACGVLYGLAQDMKTTPLHLKTVHLMTIGPDKYAWMRDRLARLGVEDPPFEIDREMLHPGFATYGTRMPYTLDGIELHPTYEGKVATYLDLIDPSWWDARDNRTLFWIVGGPIK